VLPAIIANSILSNDDASPRSCSETFATLLKLLFRNQYSKLLHYRTSNRRDRPSSCEKEMEIEIEREREGGGERNKVREMGAVHCADPPFALLFSWARLDIFLKTWPRSEIAPTIQRRVYSFRSTKTHYA